MNLLPTSPMCISKKGINLIQFFEGFRSNPYPCPGGYWTIGYGHVLQKGEENLYQKGISKKEARALLERDVYKTEAAIHRLICVSLTQNQRDALGSFTFNVGAGALQRSRIRVLVNREEHNQVPQELLKWIWAGGRKHKGLLQRRKKEGEIYQEAGI